jgi:ABC-type hemin transport system ATPase subunit
MTKRREKPLPKLSISLEALPLPEPKRTHRMMLSFTDGEVAMIEKAARERGEQPAVLLRTIVLTAFQNSAMRALADRPDLLELSPGEQQRALLEAFSIE